jgi:hypothetical protein
MNSFYNKDRINLGYFHIRYCLFFISNFVELSKTTVYKKLVVWWGCRFSSTPSVSVPFSGIGWVLRLRPSPVAVSTHPFCVIRTVFLLYPIALPGFVASGVGSPFAGVGYPFAGIGFCLLQRFCSVGFPVWVLDWIWSDFGFWLIWFRWVVGGAAGLFLVSGVDLSRRRRWGVGVFGVVVWWGTVFSGEVLWWVAVMVWVLVPVVAFVTEKAVRWYGVVWVGFVLICSKELGA